jgi:hypothetical protein
MEELSQALEQMYFGVEPPGCSLQEEDQSDMREQELPYTPMEALDIVKEKYAANFIRQETDGEEIYYYKLPDAEYYLVYEGQGATEDEYIIHLYEFVTDDPIGNIGHTVTYGWYRIDRNTGEITEN